MKVRLKPLHQQVLVITGGSSGIGLTTARRAAARRARVVLVARNEEDLQRAAADIERRGGRAVYLIADVANAEALERVAKETVATFGRIDTWVNNAGVSFYGELLHAPIEDMRQVFEVNFWGVVNGSRAAVPHLRAHGGALINVGSVLSDRAVPLQGTYSASKHAVKGFTDALRMELEHEAARVSVTLVKPSAIATPYYDHARNYMAFDPKPPAPVYDPETVAEAILNAAERPVRDVTVGGGGRLLSALGTSAPRLTDRYMHLAMFRAQQSDRPASRREDNLFGPPTHEGEERGSYEGRVMRSSMYTRVALARGRGVLAAGIGLAAFAGVRALTRADG
ncbi:MAG TPA: SDR family oxidoreductase [Gemmatimonadales bacterium]|nr:SDR family oxidoreductase [Gemmatimonadales bacterium]